MLLAASAQAEEHFVAATITASSGAEPWRALSGQLDEKGWCAGGDQKGLGETLTVVFDPPQRIDLIDLAGGNQGNPVTVADIIADDGQTLQWREASLGLSSVVGPLRAPSSKLVFRVVDVRMRGADRACISRITLGRGRLLVAIPEKAIQPVTGVDAAAVAKVVPTAKRTLTALRRCDARALGRILALPFTVQTGYTSESHGASWESTRHETMAAVAAACRKRAFRHFVRNRSLDYGSLRAPGEVEVADMILRWRDGAWRVAEIADLHDDE